MAIRLISKEEVSEETYRKLDYIDNPNNFNIENVILSRSNLGFIDPSMGGSPAKFKYNYINRNIDTDTESTRFGSKLHRYLESPDTFCPFEADKPTGKLGEIANALERLIDIDKIITYDDTFEETSYQTLRSIGWNKNWKEEVIKNNNDYKNLLKYLKEYIQFISSGKIAMTKAEKVSMENIIRALDDYPAIKNIIYSEGKREVGYIGNFVYVEDDIEYPFRMKALIDLELDNMIIDYKSTSGSITNFEKELNLYKIDRQLNFYSLFYPQPVDKRVIVFEVKQPNEIAFININRRTNHHDLIRMAIRCFYGIDGNDFKRIHTHYARSPQEYDTNYTIIEDKES